MVITAIDWETTGKIPTRIPNITHPAFPRAVSVAAIQIGPMWQSVSEVVHIIKPEGFVIPEDAIRVHGITNERALTEGKDARCVLAQLNVLFRTSDVVLAHNLQFDRSIYLSECSKLGVEPCMPQRQMCTMLVGATLLKIPGKYGDYKWPDLEHLFTHLFGRDNDVYKKIFGHRDIHDARDDALAAALCGVKMLAARDGVSLHPKSTGGG